MKTFGNIRKISIFVVLTLLCLCSVVDAKMENISQEATTPPSEVLDLVYHTSGNIATTFLNWGLMGGYADIPSGEWPRGSGHNYCAEIKYWMGATLPSGDTVVANTDDDFTPLINFASAADDYRIRLSTDESRYEYDPTDTVGIGLGKPAYGWRNFNLATNSLEYNQIYYPVDENFYNGGPIAQQESQYIMNDSRWGQTALGITVTQTVYQWNYEYNKDFLFVVLNIKNTSENDYTDFAFGLYCDFDVGGYYQGENGRLGDVVAYDTLENLAWTFDSDNYDAGWGAGTIAGRMGTRYLETPGGLGMTSFRTGIWDSLPDNDVGRYALINSERFDEPLPPNDQYYIQCTRGINLPSGAVVRVVYALVAGQTDEELIANSQIAQIVYTNHFITPEPPPGPQVFVTPGDNQVRIHWNNYPESVKDPMTGEVDFVGYRLYRSANRGSTWGVPNNNVAGELQSDWTPIAIFRKDETTGMINHTYVDSSLMNGWEYWYCVTSFDNGYPEFSIDPMQSDINAPENSKSSETAVPRTDPSGYVPIQETLQHEVAPGGLPSEGAVAVQLYDESALEGFEYKVSFEELFYGTFWHLINVTTGDTVLAYQTDQNSDTAASEIVEGLQVLVQDGSWEPREWVQTEFSSNDTTVALYFNAGSITEYYGYPKGGGVQFRPTYEIRFTNNGSTGYSWWDDVTPIELPFEVWNTTFGYQVMAEIGDQTDNAVWNPEDNDFIVIVNTPYDGSPHPEAFPYYHSWGFLLDPVLSGQTGDVFTMLGAPLNSADDTFTFTAPVINAAQASLDMEDIKVVPNPYIARAGWEYEEGERKIEFIHLPDDAIVRIYTLAGDLVVTLDNSDGSGTVPWNVESVNEQSVAPGVYYYHVESKYGQKIGKFAIIK